MQPVASPSPDYVPGLEHLPSPDYIPGPEHPPSPVEIPYVHEPEYPEYLAPSDDEEPLEDQPLPADSSPIAASPDYVADSDPNEDSKEDPEDDQADYPADGGDGDDEPSDDDDNTKSDPDVDPEEEPFEDEEDDEEEEHLAPADLSAVPIIDHVLLAGDTEALEDDEPTDTPGSPHIIIPLSQTRLRMTRKTVRPDPSMSASMEACIAKHAALLSPPLHVPSPPLPLPSPLTTSLTDTGAPLGYRFEVGESSTAGAARQPGPTESDLRRYTVEHAGYGITDTWDNIVDTLMGIAPTTLEGVNERVTELDTTVRQRTDEFEIRFKEAQDDRALLRARVNTLFRDRPDHHRTFMLLDREAMYAREAWTQLTTALGRIEILEARDPEPQEGPTEAGSSWTFVYLLSIIDSAETGPPRVIMYGYDGLPIQPVALPSPDYVPGPEHPPSPDYADYPADGGNGNDEPYDDDDDDDTDVEGPEEEPFEKDDEEEEDYPTPAYSPTVPIVDLVLSARETEALEADEPTHAHGSPISIPLSHTRCLTFTTTTCTISTITFAITTSLTDTGAPLGYRVAGIRIRALLPSTSHRTDIPEADMPHQKKACLTAPTLGFEIGESSAAGAARQPGPTESDLRRCRVEQA
nr:hypothetical protein [Tanacetum cinerariifolium]